MFTNLDPIKISTESQNARVFHFNGANAARMLKKTKDSEKIQALSNKNLLNVSSSLLGQTILTKLSHMEK